MDQVGVEPTTSATALKERSRKRKGVLLEAGCIFLLIIRGNKVNIPKIPSAYKPYRTIWL
jgi:hypothetical protein